MKLLSLISPLRPGGVGASEEQRAQIEEAAFELERETGRFRAPAAEDADAALTGAWRVLYANAPPPSNGQLGPWVGLAYQCISARDGAYENRLGVGDGDRPWLRATLRADWDVLAPDAWKVHFRALRFDARLGPWQLPPFENEFPDGTSRYWRFSYTDDDIRLVRAGQGDGKVSTTGQLLRVKGSTSFDDCLFVLQRDEHPPAWARLEPSDGLMAPDTVT